MDLSELPTFEITNQTRWNELCAKMSKTWYGESVLNFTALWAKKMEAQLANGVSVRACAENTATEVEKELDGVADFVYGYATQVLRDVWKHGDAVAHVYNL